MLQDPLMEIRTALLTSSNNDWSGGTTLGGAEINKKVDKIIADTINRGVDLRPLVARKPLDQYAYIWNLRINLGSTSKAAFYSEGAAGTPYPSQKVQLYASVKALRSDYEVSGLMMASSISYYDALEDEAKAALDELKLAEEKAMICGNDTNAYGLANSYLGLLQLMRWHSTNGGDTESTAANQMQDTTTVYGITRSASTSYLDVSYVIAGTAGSATGSLSLEHLDRAITLSNKHGGKGKEKIFFCSEERVDEINQLLQPQQRFAGTLNLEGGFTITTYKGVPIVGSRFMDKNGATNTSSWDSSTDADNSMYLLVLDYLEFRVLAGVDAKHVPIIGSGTATGTIRADVQGGYFKTYGVFVMKAFNPHVHICNLSAP